MTRTILDTIPVNTTQVSSPDQALGNVPAPHFRCRPRLTLEIIRGNTSLRLRTVAGAQFFVGSDEDCELQLSHPEIPPVMAVIRVLDDGVWLEACQAIPAILVNHAVLKHCWLQDGDEIELGPFTLKAHMGLRGNESKAMALSLPEQSSLRPDPVTIAAFEQDEEPKPAELEISELIDRLEQDMLLVEADERCRRTGEDTLLRAIRVRQTAMKAQSQDSESVQEEEVSLPQVSIRLRFDQDLPPQPRHSSSNLLTAELECMIAELNRTLRPLDETTPRNRTVESPFSRETSQDLDTLIGKLQELRDRSDSETPPLAIA